MGPSARNLTASQAAARLGVSIKALRLYERQGLISPGRTQAGWRTYGPAEMARAREVVSLRGLGLSLAQVASLRNGDPAGLDAALAAHETRLRADSRGIGQRLFQVRRLRSEIACGRAPSPAEVANLIHAEPRLGVAFELPWPWGGEWFELDEVAPLTYLTGPLGSGKTRLAKRLAEKLPDAMFLGLDRLSDDGEPAQARLEGNAAVRSRVERSLAWLVDEGATRCDALTILLAAVEAETPAVLVVDIVEQGLDQPTQEALMAHLRLRIRDAKKLILLTRSSSILDLAAVGPGEAIIYCPANHSPPLLVAPFPAAPGYEAVASCLATPEVRARAAGIVALSPSSSAA